MSGGLKLDTGRWQAALSRKIRLSRTEGVKALNKSALQVLIGSKGYPGAMRMTPKAAAAAIRAIPERLLYNKTWQRMKRKGIAPTRENFRIELGRVYKQRTAAAGYTAFAGWNNAALAFGGRGIGSKKQSGFGKSQASKGSGKRANQISLKAVLINTAPAANSIGVGALQQGINNQADDIDAYLARKLLKN